MKPRSGDRFYSERSRTGLGLHASSVSFQSSAFRRRHHQKQDRSLNLSRVSNKKSLSRLIDPHSTRTDLHQHQDVSVSELHLKTKFLNEIFLNREEQLWEDLEAEEIQVAGLESNLNMLSKSVKVLKDSIMASISERCRPIIPRKSTSPGHMRLQLEDAFHDFLLSREKQPPAPETCKTEVVSPKSATTNRLISLLNHRGVMQAPSRIKLSNQNLSMDSQARMNLSNPTITEYNFDPADQMASISSFKRLVPCDSGKNWQNLYSGHELTKHSYGSEGGQNLFVSRLKLTQDQPELTARQNLQKDNTKQDLLGSSSHRNLRAVLPSDSFLTQRDSRNMPLQEATSSSKLKPLTPRLAANPMFKSTVDTGHHKVAANASSPSMITGKNNSLCFAGLNSPKSPRVESLLAKMEHLINPTTFSGTLTKTQSDLQKSRPANFHRKETQTPKITTLKIASHTVIYGPGKRTDIANPIGWYGIRKEAEAGTDDRAQHASETGEATHSEGVCRGAAIGDRRALHVAGGHGDEGQSSEGGRLSTLLWTQG